MTFVATDVALGSALSAHVPQWIAYLVVVMATVLCCGLICVCAV
jgi:hypothetical protein